MRNESVPRVVIVDEDESVRRDLGRALDGPSGAIGAYVTGDPGRAIDALVRAGKAVLVVREGDFGHEMTRRARSLPGQDAVHVLVVRADCANGDLWVEADDFVSGHAVGDELPARVRRGLRSRGEAASERVHELEAVNARYEQFLTVVSHEIRTPLSAVISAAGILKRYGTTRPETVERFATVIHEEGRRLTRLINNLLDLEKIEAGQRTWTFAPCRLGELLETARESFQALAGERRVALVVETAPDVGEAVIDRDTMLQVLANLLSNAVKHSPEGGSVFLRCRRSIGDGFVVEVEDEGEGIPPGAEERIFQRFQQLAVDDERRGTGLGLTISLQIVQRHGGRLYAAAGRERGALLVVELPGGGEESEARGPVR